jgi:hypothetical protein
MLLFCWACSWAGGYASKSRLLLRGRYWGGLGQATRVRLVNEVEEGLPAATNTHHDVVAQDAWVRAKHKAVPDEDHALQVALTKDILALADASHLDMRNQREPGTDDRGVRAFTLRREKHVHCWTAAWTATSIGSGPGCVTCRPAEGEARLIGEH